MTERQVGGRAARAEWKAESEVMGTSVVGLVAAILGNSEGVVLLLLINIVVVFRDREKDASSTRQSEAK